MLIKISEAASLAMHTMVYLANQDDKPFTTKAIASVFQASVAHLSKVMQRLTKAGFVKSIRGPNGGFSINIGAKKSSLLDVFQAIDGPITKPPCLFANPICDSKQCIMGATLESLCAQLIGYLKKTRLCDIPVPAIPLQLGSLKKLSMSKISKALGQKQKRKFISTNKNAQHRLF